MERDNHISTRGAAPVQDRITLYEKKIVNRIFDAIAEKSLIVPKTTKINSNICQILI